MNRMVKIGDWSRHGSRHGIIVLALSFILAALVQCTQSVDGIESRVPSASAEPAAPATASGGSKLISDQPWIAIARQAKASVVNISSVRKTKQSAERPPRSFFDDPFFRRFFGEEFERRLPLPPERREQGLGSGVIVTPDGYIVTNNHVVEGSDELRVSLPDKRTFKAKVVGTDPKTDLAVIKIDASNLPVLPWGNSSDLQVGEMVLAVGNPFGLSQTVTMGIISATGRANMGIVDYEDFIQTDAAINPGNSGGALVNMQGHLIGINTAIFSQSGGNMGIGFAIPSNMARSVMNSLLKHGKVVRGWLGVSIQEVTPDLAKEFGVSEVSGALVADVLEDSPAAKAKIERGDIITSVNGTVIRDPVQLRSIVADTAPGTDVTVSVLRDKKPLDVKITVGELPKEMAQAARGESGTGTGDHALAGVTVEDAAAHSERERRTSRRTGVVVTDIEPDSPAERAGLRVGDVIREINRKPVKTVGDFERITRDLTAKSAVLLLLNRGNATIFLSIQP
ncbi:MAG TPA: DegQ family serine endoprotease [Nitrospiraceae bacterium]|nr:DegQ family serine endoprotease [Nitrospiraceae bacterium]